jgi:hypothetical protein
MLTPYLLEELVKDIEAERHRQAREAALGRQLRKARSVKPPRSSRTYPSVASWLGQRLAAFRRALSLPPDRSPGLPGQTR